MTRPRLQLHLSTLLIVSLLAAGLVWLNARERVSDESGLMGFVLRKYCGFPFDCAGEDERRWYRYDTNADDFDGNVQKVKDLSEDKILVVHDKHSDVASFTNKYMFWQPLILNIAIGLALLAVASVAIEWVTRCMARKPRR
jgi:hypothetical protein